MTDRLQMNIIIDAMTMVMASVDEDDKKIDINIITPCKYVDRKWDRYYGERDTKDLEAFKQNMYLYSSSTFLSEADRELLERILHLAKKGADIRLPEEGDPECENCPECGHYEPEAELKRIDEVGAKIDDVVMTRLKEDYYYFKEQLAKLGVPFGEMHFDCLVKQRGGNRF
jgi:hypothetical protein